VPTTKVEFDLIVSHPYTLRLNYSLRWEISVPKIQLDDGWPENVEEQVTLLLVPRQIYAKDVL
jgi:hypothetical protein